MHASYINIQVRISRGRWFFRNWYNNVLREIKGHNLVLKTFLPNNKTYIVGASAR